MRVCVCGEQGPDGARHIRQANVLTGAVNLSMETLYVDDARAILILAAYLTTVCGVAILLHARGLTLKAW
jgi:hypothetical protein